LALHPASLPRSFWHFRANLGQKQDASQHKSGTKDQFCAIKRDCPAASAEGLATVGLYAKRAAAVRRDRRDSTRKIPAPRLLTAKVAYGALLDVDRAKAEAAAMSKRLAIIGAGSVTGRMLRQIWADRGYLWLSRAEWRVEDGSSALVPQIARADAVFCLAGVGWAPGDFSLNVRIAREVAAAAPDVPVLFSSSQAVYGALPGPLSEDTDPAPRNDNGRSKLAMEEAVRGQANVTCLRQANVVGADMLGRNITAGRALSIDTFPDGRTPRRSYLDPKSLALAIEALVTQDSLPPVLNLARAPALEMGALARAAGQDYAKPPAPAGVLQEVEMDLTRLFQLVPALAAPVSAAEAVASWQSCKP
jgi:nucleoside-diphosphate-sugar epimerase